MRLLKWLPGVALACLPAVGSAVDEISLEARREGEVFHLSFEYHIDAPAARVRALVTDPARLEELSPSTEVSRVERDPATGRERLHLELRPCVLIFCRHLTKVSLIEQRPDGSIVYRAMPERSDFRSAVETLRIVAAGEGTRVSYRARLIPKFFVPPLIGDWLVARTFGRDVAATARNVERVLAGGEPHPGGDTAPAPLGPR